MDESLTACMFCGNDYPATSESCPHCGHASIDQRLVPAGAIADDEPEQLPLSLDTDERVADEPTELMHRGQDDHDIATSPTVEAPSVTAPATESHVVKDTSPPRMSGDATHASTPAEEVFPPGDPTEIPEHSEEPAVAERDDVALESSAVDASDLESSDLGASASGEAEAPDAIPDPDPDVGEAEPPTDAAFEERMEAVMSAWHGDDLDWIDEADEAAPSGPSADEDADEHDLDIADLGEFDPFRDEGAPDPDADDDADEEMLEQSGAVFVSSDEPADVWDPIEDERSTRPDHAPVADADPTAVIASAASDWEPSTPAWTGNAAADDGAPDMALQASEPTATQTAAYDYPSDQTSGGDDGSGGRRDSGRSQSMIVGLVVLGVILGWFLILNFISRQDSSPADVAGVEVIVSSTTTAGSEEPSETSTTAAGEDEPDSSTTTSATTSTTAPTTTVAPVPVIEAIGDPLGPDELQLGAFALGVIDFGDTDGLGKLVATYGQPDSLSTTTGGFGLCEGVEGFTAAWGPLTGIFTGDTTASSLEGYRMSSGGGDHPATELATLSGFRVGDSVGQLKSVYSGFDVSLDETEGDFVLSRTTDGVTLLWGPVSSIADDGTVLGVFSPNDCDGGPEPAP